MMTSSDERSPAAGVSDNGLVAACRFIDERVGSTVKTEATCEVMEFRSGA